MPIQSSESILPQAVHEARMVTKPEGPLKAEGSVSEQCWKSESHVMEGQPLVWS